MYKIITNLDNNINNQVFGVVLGFPNKRNQIIDCNGKIVDIGDTIHGILKGSDDKEIYIEFEGIVEEINDSYAVIECEDNDNKYKIDSDYYRYLTIDLR